VESTCGVGRRSYPPIVYRVTKETDAPALCHLKGERNEPANLHVSLQAIAEVKKLPLAEVARTTTANAQRLFRLPSV